MSKKIRVMHIVLSMHYGGLEKIVNKIVKKIDRDKFVSTVCCLDRGGDLLDDIPNDWARKYVFNRKPGLVDFGLLKQLVTLVRKENIEIIHSHSGCTFYAAVAGRIGGVKGIIHTDHGRLVPDRVGSIIEDRIFSRFMDRFVSVSEELTCYLRDVIKIPKKKLVTITNGVDAQEFKPLPAEKRDSALMRFGIGKDSIVLGTVCRLDPVKNIPFLLRTLANLIKKNCNVLLVVGDGPERVKIEDTISALGIKDSVKMLGKSSDIPSIMPLFDMFILPSLSEGTSMTILEAMACGVPVIASNVGGNKKLIRDGESGYLFELERPELLIERVEGIIRNPKEGESLGRRGREIVESEFSFEGMLKAYSSFYQCLAK